MLDCVKDYKAINGYAFGKQLAEMLDIKPYEVWDILNCFGWDNKDFWNCDDLEYYLIDHLVEYIPYNPDEEEQEGFDIKNVEITNNESKIFAKMYNLLKKGEIPNYFILLKNW